MVDFESAEKKIDKIMVKWFTEDPLLLATACLLNRRADKGIDTMGIDIRGRTATLIYNPNFVNQINSERLELVMVSEYYKVLLRHCTSRLKDPKQISALSSSITINQLHNNDPLLKDALSDINDIAPSPSQYGLEPNQYFEEYFRNLMDHVKETNEKIKQIFNSMSDEDKEKMMNPQGQGEGDGQGECKEESGEGQGSGQPSEGQGFKEFSNDKNAMKDYFDPNGNNNKGWGESDMFDSELRNMINEHKHSGKSWGKHTGNAMGMIIAAHEPKISYKEVLRHFKRSITTPERKTSRMKVNRRYDLLFPGSKQQYKSKVMFAIDVSGSMSDEDLAEGFSVINQLFKFSDVIFVEFDTEIKAVERKLKKARKEFKVHGRGGTDFQEIINLSDKEKVDGLIIFTDGFANCPTPPKARMLWLLHSKECKVPSGCDFGSVAYLDRFENRRS